jgi:acyl CoA:acetate/3-ketoacid CoA transferase alpha subunit/acyl CoA:acetate/3-ketoacid CoA transferase beta subunit
MSDAAPDFELATDSGRSKVMPLGEAIRTFIEPGSVVHSSFTGARPCGPLYELTRQFAGTNANLTLITSGIVNAQLALIETGVVRRLVTSFAGENYPIAKPSPAFQRAVAAGRLEVENWPLWGLVARLVAGALGLPFFPVHSIAGSSMERDLQDHGYARVDDPFSPDGSIGVVSAVRPDVVLLHAVAADRHGNVALAAPYGESHWGALAARRGAIAAVERIVTTAELRRHSALVQIPAHAVLAVCETPFGAHPYSLHNPGVGDVPGYVEDHRFMHEVQQASASEEGFRAWIDEWILGVPDQQHYVDRIGSERFAALIDAGHPDAWRRDADGGVDAPIDAWNDNEMMVIAAARKVAANIRANGRDAVLAGVGLANLAAWVGVALLDDDVDVELMAEIGMYGHAPRPGEPFVFAHRNLSTVKVMTDVMGILGTLVSGPATSSMAVVGAGQIDDRGNVNSTWTGDGKFLVGSGGANDIASAADEVIVTVTHGRGRMVEELAYVTAPGSRVSAVVTTRGVFERDGDGFLLTRWLASASAGVDEDDAAVDAMRADCGWSFDVSPQLAKEPDPTERELRLLRAFDPARTFLRALPTIEAQGA